jgi:hypothetical protein
VLRRVCIVIGLVTTGFVSASSLVEDRAAIAGEYFDPSRTQFERMVTMPETGEIMWQAGSLFPCMDRRDR